MRRYDKGFTLIEILVVLAIIAMLVSMASINTSHDSNYQDLQEQAKKLKFLLAASADEALFKNKNIGLQFSKTGFQTFSRESIAGTSSTADFSGTSLEKTKYKKEWQSFTGKHVKNLNLPEHIFFELNVEGQELQLPYTLKEQPKPDEIKPQAILYASGEQTPIEIKLLIDDYEGYALVRGNGIGRYFFEVFNEEQ